MSHVNGSSDPLVVRTVELAIVLNRWIDEWRAERPLDHVTSKQSQNDVMGELSWVWDYRQQTIADVVYPMGAIDWLCQAIQLQERSLHRILKCETQHTNYTLADEILQAIERTDAVHIGEIRVIPNPRWSQEKWRAYMQERGC